MGADFVWVLADLVWVLADFVWVLVKIGLRAQYNPLVRLADNKKGEYIITHKVI